MDAALLALCPLFGELNDLKRITSAGHQGSMATRLFRRAWASVLAGRPADEVALAVTARAVVAARLGDLDRDVLSAAGLSRAQITRVLQGAIDAVGEPLDPSLRGKLRDAVATDVKAPEVPLPAFVAALERQPRAGITCPGRPRIMLEPPENHAEHCVMVAVYGVLLAPVYGANPGTVFLAALAHHFHNVGMPDAGFTGEVLLGPHLDRVIGHYTADALEQIAPPLRGRVEDARTILVDAEHPEGRAFHAADVLDRVLQVRQALVAAGLTMDRVLGEMELVHDGPVKPFHDAVLGAAGLL